MTIENQIVAALSNGPLCSVDLLRSLGIEPGGGELVPAIQNLMRQGIVLRHNACIYTLNAKKCRLCGADVTTDTSLLNRHNIEVSVCDSCIQSVHHLCDRNP